MAFDLGDYNDVAARIAEFREKYPDGTLGPADASRPYTIETMPDGQVFVVYIARASRHEGDTDPGIGSAWEPYPGKSNYTKMSELQNAETSAWGRAIIAVGAADAKKGIASREEVRNRQADHDHQPTPITLRSDLVERFDALPAEARQKIGAWAGKGGLEDVKRAPESWFAAIEGEIRVAEKKIAGEGGGDAATEPSPSPVNQPELATYDQMDVLKKDLARLTADEKKRVVDYRKQHSIPDPDKKDLSLADYLSVFSCLDELYQRREDAKPKVEVSNDPQALAERALAIGASKRAPKGPADLAAGPDAA